MAIKAAIFFSLLNPMYWFFAFITGQVQNSFHSPDLILMTLGGASWAIIAFLIAEMLARERGYFIVWYLAFFLGGILTIIWFVITSEIIARKMVKEKVTGERLANPIEKTSDRVEMAFEIYTPKRLKEFEIQDLVDNNLFDEAIHKASTRLEFFRQREELDIAKKYESLVKWLEHTRKVHYEK